MDLKQASVLLVEDEPILREIMGEWVGRVAGRAFCAADGQEALRILESNTVDLIISDVRMPEMNGITLLQKVKEKGLRAPGVIFMTGFSDLTLREAYDMGVEAILEKPIKREELVQLAKASVATKEELWRHPPDAASDLKLQASFASLADALEAKRIAFGRRGFCIASSDSLREGPVEFTLNFRADHQVMSGHGTVRWTEPQEHLIGIEITHIDDTSRPWLIEMLEQNHPVPFIPASTGLPQGSGLKTA